MSYTGLVQPTAMTSIEEVIDDTTPLINKVYSSDKVQSDVNVLQAGITPASLLDKVKTVDGLNSGLDADLLRGLPADFGSSLTGNGWQKLPSGLIIQWGRVESSSINSITWPIAFPNAALGAASVTTDGNGALGRSNIRSLTSTGALTTNERSISYIVIGH